MQPLRLLLVLLASALVASGCSTDGDVSVRSAPPVFDAGPALDAMRGLPQDGITLGRPEAPVTVAMYASLGDWNGRFAESVLPRLVEDFVRPGRVKLQLRTRTDTEAERLPQRDAEAVAATAHAVGIQDAMWQFFAIWSARFTGTGGARDVDSTVEQITSVDAQQVREDAQTVRVQRAVDRANAYARADGYTTTPVFTIEHEGEEPKVLRAARTGGVVAALQDELG